MFIENNYDIKSSSDGMKLNVLEVVPENEIKAIVQFSHGMAEYKERYLDFMRYLASNGYICVINDHRGHGNSVVSKEDYGYFYEEDASFIVDDLHDVSTMIKDKYPNLPLYLFGHSMGSMIVRKYISRYDDEINKLVVCGSPSKNPLINVAINLTKVVKKIKGDHHRSKLINSLAFGSFDLKFEGNNTNRWLSYNQNNVLDYNSNDKCGFIFTTNGFMNLFTLMKDTYDSTLYKCRNKHLPILFIAGSEDPVIVSLKAWKSSQDFLHDIGYDNISNILVNGKRHEILNEDNYIETYKNILSFLD